jgi:hypothetical protein
LKNSAKKTTAVSPSTVPGTSAPGIVRHERPHRTASSRDGDRRRHAPLPPIELQDPSVIEPLPADPAQQAHQSPDTPVSSDPQESHPKLPIDDDLMDPDGHQPSEEAQLSPDMRDAFLRFRTSQLASRSSRVALALSQVMRIRLPYPRQIEGMAEIEELKLLGRQMRGEQQLALTIFERTGTGKSTLAQQYKLMSNQEKPNSVLHARMGTSGTARDLWVSVMSELGDGFPSAGNEFTLRRRAMKAMDDAGVELLILDETQHSGQKSGFSREVTAELKIMLDTGKVPLVLLGTEKAVPLIGDDRELSGRMFSPCRLAPLEMSIDEDFELWTGLLGGLDARLVSDGVLDAPIGLNREDLAEALGDVCDGIIGQLMRVMLMSVRNTVRDSRRVMTMEDMVYAVDEWSLEHGFANSNPLRDL